MKKLLFILTAFFFTLNVNAQNYKLIVGTFTRANNSEGIYIFDFNTKTAESKALNIIKSPADQGYLTLNKNVIYSTYLLKDKSAVTAYSFDHTTGQSSLINQLPAGQNPCYIITDGNNVITANYGGGSINVYGLNKDGSLNAEKQLIQHTGSGPDPRQASAHVHQVMFSPDKKYVLSSDLGEDKIYIYKYDVNAAQPLSLLTSVTTDAGSGPRHLTFSPNGKFVYLTHEFTGKISAFTYKAGKLALLQQVSTVPNDFKGKIDGADIHISADEKFLYQTNRGDANTISTFSIAKNGTLTFIETISTLGKGPRNFSLDPSGNFLLIAHQYTNDIIIFKRNQSTGKLEDSGKRINVGTPVCLVFSK